MERGRLGETAVGRWVAERAAEEDALPGRREGNNVFLAVETVLLLLLGRVHQHKSTQIQTGWNAVPPSHRCAFAFQGALTFPPPLFFGWGNMHLKIPKNTVHAPYALKKVQYSTQKFWSIKLLAWAFPVIIFNFIIPWNFS